MKLGAHCVPRNVVIGIRVRFACPTLDLGRPHRLHLGICLTIQAREQVSGEHRALWHGATQAGRSSPSES